MYLKYDRIPRPFRNFYDILVKNKVPMRLVFIVSGIASTIWFLFRVIPKPSRASYPCMQAAAPFMSSFIIYLIGLTTAIFAFKKAKQSFVKAKYLLAFGCLVAAIVATFLFSTQSNKFAFAGDNSGLEPNQPFGEAKGVIPGRVVWIHDADATNPNCTNKYNADGWFLPQNNRMDIIQKMVDNSIQNLVGKSTNKDAWTEIFKYFNKNHGKGEVGYKTGEKIFIKTNATSTYGISSTFAPGRNVYGIAETNPYMVLALLRHLVNDCGVDQKDISVGDPMKDIYKHCLDLWYAEFPNVNYISNIKIMKLTDKTGIRISPAPSEKPLIFYSEKNTLRTNVWAGNPDGDGPVTEDKLYTVIEQADYLINIPTLKGHKRAGVTMCAKIHFGSHTRGDASHLHNGLINPTEGDPLRQGYGLYRVLVDIMSNKYLGGNTLLFLMDALYAGSEATDPPRKFQMAPFNNNWASSIFTSLDPVAIESVGFDFLRTEFTKDSKYPYPQMAGVDDHLHQAADSANWPIGLKYNSNNDGKYFSSLGVHEHWNNAVEMKYTKIDFIKLEDVGFPSQPTDLIIVVNSSSEIKLNWSDNSNKEEKFIVERSATDNSKFEQIASLDPNTIEYIDKTLKGSTTYFYRVKATKGTGSSAFTPEQSAATPAAPTGISADEKTRSVNIFYSGPKLLTARINDSFKGTVEINIYELSGKQVFSSSYQKQNELFEQEINLENFQSNIYIINLKIGNEKISKKIWKF